MICAYWHGGLGMKSIVAWIAAGSLLATLAPAQPPRPRYAVIDLGIVGALPGQPFFITSNGLVAGAAAAGANLHASFGTERERQTSACPDSAAPTALPSASMS